VTGVEKNRTTNRVAAQDTASSRLPLRALLIEDTPDDAELVLLALRRGGYEVAFERVETAEHLHVALARGPWDVVISDYSLPTLEAPEALAIVAGSGLDLPFIIVSGTVGEETAVLAMRSGAHDFIGKDRLGRLPPAIARELGDAATRAEHRRTQEQLVVSDRMASLGTLAAGMAHEINNPLAAVLANVDLALRELSKTLAASRADGGMSPEGAARWLSDRLPMIVDSLTDAHDATLRVRDVSRDLKVFSRVDERRRGSVDVRKVLDSTLRMARNEIRHRAKLVREYQEVPGVEGDETRIGQVFLNLVINAAQALPEGAAGRNSITVATRMLDAEFVLVEVSDTGPGIPAEALSRVFDPFFTTKPVGVGTGLGLAICHSIVTGLGGTIEVDTRLGVGTTFRVALPVAKSETDDDEPLAFDPWVEGPRAKILVVDDDGLVAAALARVLSAEHDVTTLTSGREAYDRLIRRESFDIVICDLLMPELTGMALYDALMEEAPDVAGRMVFMTGGAFTPGAREFLERVRQPRIEKPFDVPLVRALIRELVK
jgi:signal transduction histidine kinase